MIIVLHGHDELGIRRRLEALRGRAGRWQRSARRRPRSARRPRREARRYPRPRPHCAPSSHPSDSSWWKAFSDGSSHGERNARPASTRSTHSLPRLADGVPEMTTLVYCRRGAQPAAQPPPPAALGAARGRGRVLSGAERRASSNRFVREEATRHGVAFRKARSIRPLPPDEEWRRPKEADPAQLLAVLHPNTLELSHELEKLALFTMSREATVDDVDLLAGASVARPSGSSSTVSSTAKPHKPCWR